jgi:hypothetical protein
MKRKRLGGTFISTTGRFSFSGARPAFSRHLWFWCFGTMDAAMASLHVPEVLRKAVK